MRIGFRRPAASFGVITKRAPGENGDMEGEYWLKRQLRIGHWARVRVRVEPGPRSEVRVAAEAGRWLGGVDDTGTSTGVPDDLKEASVSGAKRALADAGMGGTFTITITGIQHVPVDTSADDVRFAASAHRFVRHVPISHPSGPYGASGGVPGWSPGWRQR